MPSGPSTTSPSKSPALPFVAAASPPPPSAPPEPIQLLPHIQPRPAFAPSWTLQLPILRISPINSPPSPSPFGLLSSSSPSHARAHPPPSPNRVKAAASSATRTAHSYASPPAFRLGLPTFATSSEQPAVPFVVAPAMSDIAQDHLSRSACPIFVTEQGRWIGQASVPGLGFEVRFSTLARPCRSRCTSQDQVFRRVGRALLVENGARGSQPLHVS